MACASSLIRPVQRQATQAVAAGVQIGGCYAAPQLRIRQPEGAPVSPACIRTFAFSGVEAVPVEAQVQISSGLPTFTIAGLPDKVGRAARERVRAALAAMGLSLPSRRVLINLEPANLLKEASHFDLPVALGVLAAMDLLPREELAGYAALGELSLDGALNPVAGVLSAAFGAAADGLGLICPASQGCEAAWAARVEVLAAPDLLAIINHFRGTQVFSPPELADAWDDMVSPDLAGLSTMGTAKPAHAAAAGGGHCLRLRLEGRRLPFASEAELFVTSPPAGPLVRDLLEARAGIIVACLGCGLRSSVDLRRAVGASLGAHRVGELRQSCSRCGGTSRSAHVRGLRWGLERLKLGGKPPAHG